jgi:hypothetical protein
VSKGGGAQAASRKIGIDFDNTIVSYDEIFHKIALQRELIGGDCPKSKREIRDQIRLLPNGEEKWQKVQAVVYGPAMGEARLIDGVKEFFALCRNHGVSTCIVSHKTEYANYDETATNLRSDALGWMEKAGFFSVEGLKLKREDVFFEPTRLEKVWRISMLNCSHFIDDLVEVFQEDAFPQCVEQILYAPQSQHNTKSTIRVAATWEQIGCYIFSGN